MQKCKAISFWTYFKIGPSKIHSKISPDRPSEPNLAELSQGSQCFCQHLFKIFYENDAQTQQPYHITRQVITCSNLVFRHEEHKETERRAVYVDRPQDSLERRPRPCRCKSRGTTDNQKRSGRLCPQWAVGAQGPVNTRLHLETLTRRFGLLIHNEQRTVQTVNVK